MFDTFNVNILVCSRNGIIHFLIELNGVTYRFVLNGELWHPRFLQYLTGLGFCHTHYSISIYCILSCIETII